MRKLYETRNPDREWPEKNGVPGWNICFVASAVLHMTGEHDDELLHPQFLASSLLLCSLDNAGKSIMPGQGFNKLIFSLFSPP